MEIKNMAKITRQEARETLFALLFEIEFRGADDPVSIYELACDNREIPDDKYIRQCFFSIISRSDLLDAVITKYSRGWKAGRLSKVSRSVLRIAVYEMLFAEDIPMNVSISQAVELSLKYGEDKAKQFVNGVLSGLFKDVQANGVDSVIEEAAAVIAKKADAPTEQEAETKEAVEVEENA